MTLDEKSADVIELIKAAINAGNSQKRGIHAWLVANHGFRESVRSINKLLYRFDGEHFERAPGPPGVLPHWRVIGPEQEVVSRWGWETGLLEKDSPIQIRPDRWYRLRDWQKEAIRAWSANDQRGLVEAVTGAGKSDVGIAIVEHFIHTGKRVLILTPGNTLREQWAQRLRADVGDPLGVKIVEVATGKSPDWKTAKVILAHPVSTNNAIKNGSLDPTTIGVLIGDEAHNLGAAAWRNALAPQIPARLGLSATLAQDEGFADVLAPYFGRVVYEYGFGRAYGDGHIAPFRLAYVGCEFSATEQAVYDAATERYDKGRRQLAKLVPEFRAAQGAEYFKLLADLAASQEQTRESIAASQVMKALADQRGLRAQCSGKFEALPHILEVSEKRRRGIVFAHTKAAAEQVVSACGQAGVKCRLVTGATPATERRKILDEFRAGKFQILVGPQVLNQGLDIPEVDFGVVLAASRSEREMKQRFGRALRLKEDGRDAAIVVMYAIGTTEAPDFADGPRDGFMGELEDFCDPAAESFLAKTDIRKAVEFLSETTIGG